jgi:hypothetical protein
MIEIKFTIDPELGVYEQLRSFVEAFAPPTWGSVSTEESVTRVTPSTPVEMEPTEPKKRGRKAKETTTKDVAVEVATPDVNEQDVADESAEAASDKLTHDDIRDLVGQYTKKHGIALAQKNIPQILGGAIADIPDDQTALQVAIFKLREAMGATPVAMAGAKQDIPLFANEEPAPVKEITEQDVRNALMAYAAKYDVDDKMANTLVDGPDILKKTFGPTVSALRLIPKDPASLKKAYDAVQDAIENNWYNRKVVA